MDDSPQFANPDRQAECEMLRARVAELERENNNMAEELERQFREDILRDFGVTYEELLANPEKHVQSSELFRQELDRLLDETRLPPEHEAP